jgi:L-lactate dehydrogenase complex protein LldG
MTAREEILQRLRAALGDTAAPAGEVTTGVVTRRDYQTGDDPGADRLALLADRLADYRATVRRCPVVQVGAAVAAALAGTRLVVAPADLPAEWLAGYQGAVARDRDGELSSVADLDAAGVSVVTGCAVAIAETGTIVLDASERQGRRALTLVPDHHVCVVLPDQVAVSVPAGLARLADPRRPLTFISGPSATSDIELVRVEGVHGPRRLDVVLVG